MKHLGDFTNPKVAKLYVDVPPADWAKYQTFCTACPYKQIVIGDGAWPYLDNNHGDETLLILSGALAIPDISWLSIAHFAEQYRVIAPAYPAVKTMTALVDGIAEILRSEGITQAHVLGGSYGGFVAQVFVRRHPQLVRSLILSHTFPPDQASGRKIKKVMGWLSLAPQGWLRGLMGKRLGSLLPARKADTALLHAMYQEVLSHRLTKADTLSGYWRMVDYCEQHFSPQDLAGWPGKVLLVMADDDPGTPEPVRAALSALYPGARMHLFHGTGHATAILKEGEYQSVLDEFLQGNP